MNFLKVLTLIADGAKLVADATSGQPLSVDIADLKQLAQDAGVDTPAVVNDLAKMGSDLTAGQITALPADLAQLVADLRGHAAAVLKQNAP